MFRARKTFWISALLLSVCRFAHAQALPPSEALKHFKVAEGFEVQLFASEPQVRQPVTMTFDDRGRLWVIQYLQYPAPAGVTPVQVDRYLRTKYDRVPEPPPKGPRGADKITILEDTDGDGRADRVTDFATGLNLASALAIGNGGVYVGMAPYLLFYPDRDRDDVPDGDPEVLLTGFGMEDAHAVVNSMQWGPDGWLYGAQGSTVTADIRGIGFQQGIWRYHPATKRFELFSEGGGNTWGLDFDAGGNVIAGTNWGDAVCLHQVQGGYYVKGFTKHGPLHNPFTYGYFDHVKHQGHVGGHVTCGGIVYQGDAFPQAFRNCYIGPNLLSNEIYWHTIERAGSTFKTSYAGKLLSTDDIWFRPIDSLVGPDGSLFVADWYDQRANHVIPDDTWDKTNGRIWKIVYRGTKPAGPIDLAHRTSNELVALLSHPNRWYAREARRILSERRDAATYRRLEKIVDESANEHLALEGLWTLYASGGWNETLATRWLGHPSADVRAWSVRLSGDEKTALSKSMHSRLVALAASESSSTVRSQLACTAKRLPAANSLAIVAKLLQRGEDAADLHIPLLLWWAIEDKAVSDRQDVIDLICNPADWKLPLVRSTIIQRLARRWLAEQSGEGYAACAQLLELAPSKDDARLVLAAMEKESSTLAKRPEQLPAPLAEPLEKLLQQEPADDPTVTRLALRLGSQAAYSTALRRMANPAEPQNVRLSLIAAVASTGRADALPAILPLLDESKSPGDAIRTAALAALENCNDPTIAATILDHYTKFSAPLRARAISVLGNRRPWAAALVAAVEAGKLDAKDVSVDQVRQMLAHNDPELTAAIEARWGKIRAATPGEKMAYVPVLGRVLNESKGDLQKGHALFVKHCGNCHTLHGEGAKIGPDLTTADRKNRDALLLNVLDPSGYVRPEFVSQTVVLTDGRVLTGLVVEPTAQQITLVDTKSEKTVIERGQIEQMQPSAQSIMPERLLESLSPQEVRDLFRYLQSDGPLSSAGK
jgi:putative membrane-bound dehydrogenase-like protein